jgi:hypothetical protein
VHALARVVRGGPQPAPSGWRAVVPATLGGSLLLALALNLIAWLELAGGSLVVPFGRDEALTHFELGGFCFQHGADSVGSLCWSTVGGIAERGRRKSARAWCGPLAPLYGFRLIFFLPTPCGLRRASGYKREAELLFL